MLHEILVLLALMPSVSMQICQRRRVDLLDSSTFVRAICVCSIGGADRQIACLRRAVRCQSLTYRTCIKIALTNVTVSTLL